MSRRSTYLTAEVAGVLGPKPGYLSIEGAARYAGVSTRTIKRWITRGLPVYQGSLRGKILIRPSSIDAYLEKKPAPHAEQDLDAMVEDVLKSFRAAQASGKIPSAPAPEQIGPRPARSRPRGKWSRVSKKGAVPEAVDNPK